MKSIDLTKMENINGSANCFFVGLGYTPTGGALGRAFGGLGLLAGYAFDAYNCWNS